MTQIHKVVKHHIYIHVYIFNIGLHNLTDNEIARQNRSQDDRNEVAKRN